MATPPYTLARNARKDQNKSRIVIEGVDEPKKDPMTGVTDPKKLLKSDTQRIDKNVYDPNDPKYAHKPGAVQPNTTT
jgi:hypothetical protein